MIKNYFKIAIRNLWRNKVFSAINIFGLAMGIATSLLILLYVKDELSFDRYNKKANQIVRVIFRGSVKGEKMKEANVMPPVAGTLLADYPEVKEATRLRMGGMPTITYKDKSFRQDDFAYADPNFFEVFTLPFISGDPKTALAEPNTTVISRDIAEKYFGDEDPLGKLLFFKTENTSYKVTGVMEKMPANSHFHFNIFVSMAGLTDSRSASWMTSGYFTYLVLAPGYDYTKLQAKLPQTIDKYLGPQMMQGMGLTLSQFRQGGNDIVLYLQPLTDIHLKSDMMSLSELEPSGDISYVYIFSVIALFMMLIACINFMNLSTAGAGKRAREVGIRKVMGSVKKQLVGQFLLESFLLVSVSLLLAVFIVQLALPAFNGLSGKELNLNFATHPLLLPGLLLLNIIVGFVAGSYPAFYLSSFNPVAVLKGKFIAGRTSIGLRGGLVVFQFFISITLIVSTIVVYRQLSYIQNKKLGYDKEQVLVLPETWMLGKQAEVSGKIYYRIPGY